MNNILILHGKPTWERYENPELPKPHEANWLPWLARQMGERGVAASIPALPAPYFPVYRDWRAALPEVPVDPSTLVVAHSAGAEFFLRMMSEEPRLETYGAVLVAPYRDWDKKYGDFSDYRLARDIAVRVPRLVIMHSYDDSDAIMHNVNGLHAAMPHAAKRDFSDKGHFMLGNNMTGEEFPELARIIDYLAGETAT